MKRTFAFNVLQYLHCRFKQMKFFVKFRMYYGRFEASYDLSKASPLEAHHGILFHNLSASGRANF